MKKDLTTEVTKSKELFVSRSVTSIFSSSPYGVSKSEKKGKRLLMNHTLCARITGAGNVPVASVVLKYEVH